MSTNQNTLGKMSNYRWTICAMLFFATTVNYLDRQVLSLTWKDFIAPEFHWTDADYGDITAVFSIVYAIANLFAGRFIDWLGTKKGYLLAIFVWSLGACLHAVCGWATEHVVGIHDAAAMISATGAVASTIAITSVYFFIAARVILSVGGAGIENGSRECTVFFREILGGDFNCCGEVSGFVWMGMWMFMYKKPHENPRVNAAEIAYIEQDKLREEDKAVSEKPERKMSFMECLQYPQAWAFAIGKFMTDGVWWFFLFWTPAYISDVYGFSSDSGTAQLLIFVLYAITMLSIYGGKLPTIIINKTGMNPYAARMRAMFIFALFPLLALFGNISPTTE